MIYKEMQAPHFGRKRLLGAHPAIVTGILLSILVLSIADTLEIIPIFAPLATSFLFQFFHDIHDLLALIVVLYSTFRYNSRLGIVSALLYIVARIPVALIWISEDVMGMLHTLVASMAAFGGIWIIQKLHQTEEQREASREILRQSEEKYRDLYENAPAAFYSIGIDGLVKESNIATQLLLGYSKEELLDKNRLELYAPESIAKAKMLFEKFKRGLPVENEEMVYLTKAGRKVYGLLSASPVVDDKGQVILSRSVVRDITEIKKMQEQLMAQDRLASIGQLVSGVAHEINNPLTSIMGFSELLLKRESLTDDIKTDLTIINDEAKRTALIVKNLLSFARKGSEEKLSVDINVNIQKVLDLRRHEQSVNNIHVNTIFVPDLPQMLGNASQLQQVFLNLIVNAEQAMLEANGKGTLTVTTEIAGDVVKARFTDDGPGISPENMNRLFTPFFTTKDIGKGTGLGLSICYGIITGHGGKIYAESELGKGATFIVELPIAKPEPA